VSLVDLHIGQRCEEARDTFGRAGARDNHGGARCGHECHALVHASPLEQKHEHVTGSEVVWLESKFGFATGQIWTWANYKICSSLDALQFMLRHLGHWVNHLGDNDVSRRHCQCVDNH
jgi:hypothetical protein